ncbi:Uncharacterized protein DAT39_013057, partial [Clarias magur]
MHVEIKPKQPARRCLLRTKLHHKCIETSKHNYVWRETERQGVTEKPGDSLSEGDGEE